VNAPSGFEGLAGDVRAQIAEIFARDEPVFLLFSGGKESLTLLRFMERYSGRFKLLWVNTGFAFPHMETLIRENGERFGMVELKSDLPANWRVHGMPAEVLTMNSMWPGGGSDQRMQPWLACCGALRSRPVFDFMVNHEGPATFIQGQRNQDNAPGMGIEGFRRPAHINVASPLADWTTDQVFAFVEAKGIELPPHYAEVRSSLDCWVCPAHWGEEQGPALAGFMGRNYPSLTQTILHGARRVRQAAQNAVNLMDEAIEAAAVSAPSYVPQRGAFDFNTKVGVGDCMIASLATVTGISYEGMAAALGFTCDSVTGLPQGTDKGLTLFDVAAPLLDLGFAATMVLAPGALAFMQADDAAFVKRQEAVGVRLRLTDPTTIKRLIQGRRAVLLIGNVATPAWNHAVAWKNGRIYDVDPRRDPHWRHIDDADLMILGAVIVLRSF
jgi:3'-phosphoadenosine 5'-phosphosulfate sulfotransferase (PAPS reductase)/FAD synthetase